MLDKNNLKLLEDWKGLLIDKSDRLCFKHIKENIINIPSSKFPLYSDKIELFSKYNTYPIVDKKVEDLFNSIQYEVGKCYTNTKRLLSLLKENGIENVYPYAGWLIIGDNQVPVHHSFLVLKEDDKNYILDLGSSFTSEDIKILFERRKNNNFNMDQIREETLKYLKEKEKLPNSKRAICGQVDEIYLYIAEHRDPDIARDDFRSLMVSYPNHISYQDIDKTGKSKFQQMYYNS